MALHVRYIEKTQKGSAIPTAQHLLPEIALETAKKDRFTNDQPNHFHL